LRRKRSVIDWQAEAGLDDETIRGMSGRCIFFLLKAAPNRYDQGMALHRTKTTQQQRQWILGGLVRGLRAAVSR
jgi:hypothetical protein